MVSNGVCWVMGNHSTSLFVVSQDGCSLWTRSSSNCGKKVFTQYQYLQMDTVTVLPATLCTILRAIFRAMPLFILEDESFVSQSCAPLTS